MHVLSICSGAGGLDLGLRIADPAARTACYVEREAYAAANIVARIKDGSLDDAPIWDDLTTFDGEPWRGLVHGIAGGYPCQGESNAGQRRGIEDPRWLWPHVARVMRETDAEWGFFENVGAHLSRSFIHVLGDLQSMGFRVAAGLFTAFEAGGSHERERLFILADAGNRQFSVSGRRSESGNGSRPAGQNMADAESGRLRIVGDAAQPQDGGHIDGRDQELADTENDDRSNVANTVRPRSHARAYPGIHRAKEGAGPRNGNFDRCRVSLADTRGAGRQGRQLGHSPDQWLRSEAHGSAAELRGTLPLAAPGPRDPRWGEILAIDPTLEPSLCRVAHAMAYRVDRLRLTGNGVFPMAAALAYRTLRSALDHGRECRSADDIILTGNRNGTEK